MEKTRRDVLEAGSAGIAALLAGCSADEEGSGKTVSDEGSKDTADGLESEGYNEGSESSSSLEQDFRQAAELVSAGELQNVYLGNIERAQFLGLVQHLGEAETHPQFFEELSSEGVSEQQVWQDALQGEYEDSVNLDAETARYMQNLQSLVDEGAVEIAIQPLDDPAVNYQTIQEDIGNALGGVFDTEVSVRDEIQVDEQVLQNLKSNSPQERVAAQDRVSSSYGSQDAMNLFLFPGSNARGTTAPLTDGFVQIAENDAFVDGDEELTDLLNRHVATHEAGHLTGGKHHYGDGLMSINYSMLQQSMENGQVPLEFNDRTRRFMQRLRADLRINWDTYKYEQQDLEVDDITAIPELPEGNPQQGAEDFLNHMETAMQYVGLEIPYNQAEYSRQEESDLAVFHTDQGTINIEASTYRGLDAMTMEKQGGETIEYSFEE